MTDEQTKAVKALRDACLMMTSAVGALKYIYSANGVSKDITDEMQKHIDQATEAIQEVERWIV